MNSSSVGSRRVVMILQARMGSSRLPGKSMMPLAGKPLVSRVIERAQRCAKVDQIVLATTERSEDDQLDLLASDHGIEVFRGSEHDLVDRYYQAARRAGADVIVRIPADNPTPEPQLIDSIITFHLSSENDFTTGYSDVLDNGWPDGVGAEVFNFDALERNWRASLDPRNREHPHTFFYEHPEMFRVGSATCPAEIRRPDIVLDVNTLDQYKFMAELYEYLYQRNPEFTITDIISWYDNVYLAKSRGDGD